jgi:hypothetical protein
MAVCFGVQASPTGFSHQSLALSWFGSPSHQSSGDFLRVFFICDSIVLVIPQLCAAVMTSDGGRNPNHFGVHHALSCRCVLQLPRRRRMISRKCLLVFLCISVVLLLFSSIFVGSCSLVCRPSHPLDLSRLRIGIPSELFPWVVF